MATSILNPINDMDIFLGGNNDDFNLDLTDIHNDSFSTNWMNDVFENNLENDRLMTDAVFELPDIKSENDTNQEDDMLTPIDDFMGSFELPDDGDDKPSLSNSTGSRSSSESSLLKDDTDSDPLMHSSRHFPASTVPYSVMTNSSASTSHGNTYSRSLLHGNNVSSGNSQRVQLVMRRNGPLYLQSNGGSGYKPVVSKVKRQDSYYVSDHYDASPDSSTGYVLYPPTPPGSSNSSDSEQGSIMCRDGGDRSPVYSLTCYQGGQRAGYSGSLSGHQPSFQSPIPQSGVLLLTEDEKRTLIAEGYSIPTRLPLTKQEERNLKKVRRKIKNKISAQESRRKKKEYLETLEKRVEAYSHENNDLKRRMESLENNNRSLLSQLRHFQQLLAKSGTSAASTCLMVLVLCFAVFLAGGPQMDGPTSAMGSLHQVGYAVPQRINKDMLPSTLPADGGAYTRRLARLRRYLPTYAAAHFRNLASNGDTVSSRPDVGPQAPDNTFNAGQAEMKTDRAHMEDSPIGPHIQDPRIEGEIGHSRLLGSAKEESEDCVRAYGPNNWWWFLMGSEQHHHPAMDEETLNDATIAPTMPVAMSGESVPRPEELYVTLGNVTVLPSGAVITIAEMVSSMKLANVTHVTLA